MTLMNTSTCLKWKQFDTVSLKTEIKTFLSRSQSKQPFEVFVCKNHESPTQLAFPLQVKRQQDPCMPSDRISVRKHNVICS